MADYETIVYQVERARARIILNRPEKLNAISGQMQQEIHDALWEADNDTRVHCVILKANGRAFSAGYDLTAVQRSRNEEAPDAPVYRTRQGFDNDTWHMEQAQRLRMALFDMHKPVVAQVHGYCLAGGNDLALLCDLIIAADDARFGFPAARANGALPSQMWLYHIGPQWAKRLFFTGDTITGAEAARLGLAMKSVPIDLLEAEVEQLVDRIAWIDSDLLSANKRIVNLGLELMGARTIQRLAVETDARAHLATGNRTEFWRIANESGLKAALEFRDKPFGDGRARVDGPEIRDAEGRLVEG